MAAAGKLGLRIVHDGTVIRDVGVTSARPPAYRLLVGRTPEQAIQLAPLLYGVCGQAQRAAASAAVAAAQDAPLQPEQFERRVTCEVLQEHLWRLLLDWPRALGLPALQHLFVRWHGMLNGIAAGQGDATQLLAELSHELLGLMEPEWRAIDSYGRWRAWLDRGRGVLAPVCAELTRQESRLAPGDTAAALLPSWCIRDWLPLAPDLDAAFAARPQLAGEPRETGALAYWQHVPLLQEVLRQRPARLLARVLARLVDLLDGAASLLRALPAGRVQGMAVAAGAGLALVRTARGALLHYVRLDAGRVAEYLTVAPTEWNFHPQGALARGLIGLRESDPAQLRATVRQYVLSLDPCVEYDIEVSHA